MTKYSPREDYFTSTVEGAAGAARDLAPPPYPEERPTREEANEEARMTRDQERQRANSAKDSSVYE